MGAPAACPLLSVYELPKTISYQSAFHRVRTVAPTLCGRPWEAGDRESALCTLFSPVFSYFLESKLVSGAMTTEEATYV